MPIILGEVTTAETRCRNGDWGRGGGSPGAPTVPPTGTPGAPDARGPLGDSQYASPRSYM